MDCRGSRRAIVSPLAESERIIRQFAAQGPNLSIMTMSTNVGGFDKNS